MSFDLYLQRFESGEAAGIALDIVRDAFGSHVIEVDEDYWQLQYGSDDSSDIFLQTLPDDSSLIHTISVHRPCRDARLWQSIWLLLEMPGTLLYFPGCDAPMSRDSQIALALPDDMRTQMAAPLLVKARTTGVLKSTTSAPRSRPRSATKSA